MADEDLGTASVTITVDDTGVEPSLLRLSNRIERALDEAARDGARRMVRRLNLAIAKINPLKVEIAADTTRFRAALNSLNNLGHTELTVRPAVDPERFRRELQRKVNGIYVRVQVRPDFTDFDDRIRRHRPPAMDVRVRPNVDNDRVRKAAQGITQGFNKALKVVGGITAIASAVTVLGASAASSAVAIVGLVNALAPLVGIAGALPAVALGGIAAFKTLSLALNGVGDAFSAALGDDAKKFEESLKGLSPQAQAAAREVRALKPAFDNLKKTVQDRFFAQISGDITKTANNLKGPLTQGLAGISNAWGAAAKNALGYLQGQKAATDIRSTLIASEQSVRGFADGTNQLVAGFLRASAVVSQAFGKELAGGISSVTQRFGTFLQTAADSGALVRAVDEAINVLAQLGDIAGNIGGILRGVFTAAETSGGGFLNNLQTITQSIETFVKSAEGTKAIQGIFQALAAVAAQLGPILASIVTAFGAITPALAPIFTTIGPAIVKVFQAIAPAIAAIMPGLRTFVDALVNGLGVITSSGVLTQIGQAFGTILTAVSPLLPVIGSLVASIAGALAPVLSSLASALTPVIQAVSAALLPILPTLTNLFVQLVEAVAPFVDILGVALANTITALAPLLTTLVDAFGKIVAVVAPLLVQLANGLAPIIEQIAPLFVQLVTAITPLIDQLVVALLPVLPPIVDAFLAILTAITPLIEPITQLTVALAPLIVQLVTILAPVIQFTAEVLKWLTLNAVVPVLTAIVNILITLVTGLTDVTTAVTTFVEDGKTKFVELKDSVVESVTTLVENVKTFFTDLDDNIRRIAGDIVNSVSQFFTDMQNAAVQRAAELVVSVRDKFQELKVAVGQKASELVNDVVTFFSGLPGRIRGALGGLGGLLVSAGQDLINGLIAGVKSKVGDLVSAAKGVVGDAVSSAKSFLGIASPSKVFIQIGKFVGEGFVIGMTSTAAKIRETSTKLAKLVTDAFKGQKTNRDDVLLAQIRQTDIQLEKLAARREAIAKRIKEANEFAASTTQAALSTGALANIDQPGNGVGVGAAFFTQELNKRTSQINRFNSQIETLAKKGLRRDLISQLIGLGPERGAQLAGQLSTASAAQIKALNDAQARLDKAAKKFGQDSADRLFDAGKQSANGFLAGLKGQQKEIEKLMLSIAKALQSSIKKALGIKSPSRVLANIGVFAGQGLVKGIESMRAKVADAASRLAGSVSGPVASALGGTVAGSGGGVRGLGNQFGTQSQSGTQQAVTRAPAPSTTNVTNNIVINEVGDGEVTARRVINRLALTAGF